MSEEKDLIDLGWEDYYAGKDNKHKEYDNLIFKKIFQFVSRPKRKQKELADAIMALYLQNQSILSSLRHAHDRIDNIEHAIAGIYTHTVPSQNASVKPKNAE